MKLLEKSLHETEEERAEKDLMIQHYERLVKPSETRSESSAEDVGKDSKDRVDDDPLIHWLSYIKFHQDSFPSQTNAQFLLFERCVRALSKYSKYANDVRFVRLCCLYAEKTEHPSLVFEHLYKTGIGHETAIFYMAWGFVAEKQENFQFAEQIFQKGIRKKAKPVDKLKQRHQQFQRRMSRYWLNSTAQDIEEEGDSAPQQVLGHLSEEEFRRNDRSVRANLSRGNTNRSHPRPATSALSTFNHRTSSRPASRGSSNSNRSGFAIFVDNEENAENVLETSALSTELPNPRIQREHDRRKENTGAPEPWNQRGALAPAYSTSASIRRGEPKPTPFAIHVDEECEAEYKREEDAYLEKEQEQRSLRDERTFRPRSHEDDAEKLAKDPLRFMKNPAESTNSTKQTGKEKKKIQKLGFRGRLLKNSDGAEQCFEEERARRGSYSIASSEMNLNRLAHVPASNNSEMSIDESLLTTAESSLCLDDTTKETFQSVMDENEAVPTNRSLDRSFGHRTPRNTSNASSTIDEAIAVGAPFRKDEQTINTQLALRELSMMFSSPATATAANTPSARDRSMNLLNDSNASEILARPILEEDEDEDSGDTASPEELARFLGIENENSSTARKGGSICKDEAERVMDKEEGNTVSLSVIRNFVGNPKEIGTDKEDRKGAFAIFVDETAGAGGLGDDDENGDTASYSLVNGILGSGSGLDVNPYHSSDKLRSPIERLNPTIEAVTSPPFGDISRIALAEDGADTVDLPSDEILDNALNYSDIHQSDIQKALEDLKRLSKNGLPKTKALLDIVAGNNQIFSVDNQVLPRAFREGGKFGATVRIGSASASLGRELGRGNYGVVRSFQENPDVAVKVQWPAGCLAWEFTILDRLNKRLCRSHVSKPLPFPQVHSYIAMADGAIMGMTAASSSGLNLVDLVNVYNINIGEHVPDEVALHFTARMLHHIEILHWYGHILVSFTRKNQCQCFAIILPFFPAL